MQMPPLHQNKKRRKKIKIVVFRSLFILCNSLLLILLSSSIYSKLNIKKSVVVSAKSPTEVSFGQKNDAKSEIKIDMEKREESFPNTENIDKHREDAIPNSGNKIAYLTFDDGPSGDVTPEILDVLKQYNVRATFFVIGQMANNNKDLVKREADEGHEIGNHTYSHNYKYLYESPNNLVSDFDKCTVTIKSILGKSYTVKYVRFPGGSFGSKLKPFRDATEKAGYKFIDWNSLNGDAEANNVSTDKLLINIKETSRGKNKIIILMHDASTKHSTAEALPQIIEYLKSQGYTFKSL